ncbi:hypothetical protein E8E13_007216 [Curvularia kusanoi]|uniref:F-box domain-containing protein n=1 Tax=Curvularia kusanoi TaxID=90978 RepID=A0A9P4TM67_CURKU|nr:hypothetical protein E8E13_007216 [Curvularia kusanoi]
MTSIFSLPVEVLQHCVGYLDTAALKETRLTSRTFRDVATKSLFDVATIRVTKGNAETFTALIKEDEFRPCIRTLYLDACKPGEKLDRDGCYAGYADRRSPWLQKAVAALDSTKLPKLKKLLLDNAHACSDGLCTSINKAVTSLLASASIDIDTVTIKHLQDSCEPDCRDIKQFPDTLKKLHLLITLWRDQGGSEYDDELECRHDFFNISLNSAWLYPLQSQLTHLTLHCDEYWGLWPKWQPGQLHFPHLKFLAFGNWTIAFDWQIDFITSHGETLEQLIFTCCPILHAVDMTPKQLNNTYRVHLGTQRGRGVTHVTFPDLRWHNVLPDFKRKLPKLRHFSMARGPKEIHYWNQVNLSCDEAFDDRYTQVPCIDVWRYAIFDLKVAEHVDITTDLGKNVMKMELKPRNPYTRYTGSGWLERADEETRKKVQYPDCLEEDQEALDELLAACKSRC